MTPNRTGHRGYVFSRPFFEHRVPQHVQNLVIRDYCQQNGFSYLLSGTEYAMEGCHMVLQEIVQDIGNVAGIVMYSIFMLPENRRTRQAIYDTVLKSGGTQSSGLSRSSTFVADELVGNDEVANALSLIHI